MVRNTHQCHLTLRGPYTLVRKVFPSRAVCDRFVFRKGLGVRRAFDSSKRTHTHTNTDQPPVLKTAKAKGGRSFPNQAGSARLDSPRSSSVLQPTSVPDCCVWTKLQSRGSRVVQGTQRYSLSVSVWGDEVEWS